MSYAYVTFAHTMIDILQNLQNSKKKIRLASGCPWYVRNVDLHKDFQLESLKEFCKRLVKLVRLCHYKRADSHSNPLIVKAC